MQILEYNCLVRKNWQQAKIKEILVRRDRNTRKTGKETLIKRDKISYIFLIFESNNQSFEVIYLVQCSILRTFPFYSLFTTTNLFKLIDCS